MGATDNQIPNPGASEVFDSKGKRLDDLKGKLCLPECVGIVVFGFGFFVFVGHAGRGTSSG